MKKKLYFLGALLCSVSFVLAQEQIEKRIDDNHGAPKFIVLKKGTSARVSSIQLLQDLVQPQEEENYELRKIEQDEFGGSHEVYQHYYKGLPVEFSSYKVHFKNGVPESLNGNKLHISELMVSPSLSEEAALQQATSFVGASSYKWEVEGDTYQPNGNLVIVPRYFTQNDLRSMEPVLAYKFDIYAHAPISRDYVYVDAKTGEIVLSNPIIKHAVATATGTAATRYSGSQTIKTDSNGGSYRLRDYTRGNGIETYDMNTGTNYNSAVDFTDNDNNWTAAEWDNAQKDNAALDAHWGAQMTYDYFSQFHGRNSYNNNGAVIRSYVHYDANYDNAFWDGSRMTYGDGSGTYFDALTSLDVAAHEIGHAVCSSTANLVYQRESGALNEGYSDIWGAAVEAFAAPNKNEWLIGEDIERRSGHAALRSMSDPNSENQPDTYGGTYWQNPNCGTPTRNNDYCGVHTNSGVLNFWFYLTTVGGSGTNDIGNAYSVSAIGITKAAAVAYRTESVYLNSSSDFADARLYSIQSAVDLYGADSPEEITVTNAWHAVGVGAAYNGGGTTCDVPTGLAASNVASTTFTVSWNAVSGASSYDLEINGAIVSDNTTATSVNLTGATANTNYSAKVRANCGTGSSAYSTAISITTTGGGSGGLTCSSTISSFPYAESFESGFGAWAQASGDDFDWSRNSGGTPSRNTGPSSANDGSYYAYMEASSPNYPTKSTILESPCFDLSAETEASFSFDYHMYGAAAMGGLVLEAKTSDAGAWSSIWSASGNKGNSWQTASVNMSAYLGGQVKLRFTANTTSTWQGDIAIDKLAMTNGSTGGGDTNVTLTLVLDNYPTETSWTLKDSNGGTIASGSGYTNSQKNATITENFVLPAGCYDFTINDSYGDGICCSYGNGSYALTANGSTLASGGSFTSTETKSICVGGASAKSGIQKDGGLEAIENLQTIDLYPNPVKEELNIQINGINAKEYLLYDVSGKMVRSGSISNNNTSINMSDLELGFYTIKILDGKSVYTKKIIKE